MFKTGIILNDNVYGQARVFDALSRGGLNKFIPNFTVTPQIFYTLYSMLRTN